MRQIVRIGLDIAKRWFQVHAVDEAGKEILNRKLPRDKVLGFLGSLPACEVALEACSSSHHWGREIGQLGHRVRLISPNYVKPFVKRSKSDAHAARAEAASRPDMRFVRVKTEKQQAALMQHTSRQLLIDQRTAVANSLRGQLAEFGVIEKQGIENLADLVRRPGEHGVQGELGPIVRLINAVSSRATRRPGIEVYDAQFRSELAQFVARGGHCEAAGARL
jgi:transposase